MKSFQQNLSRWFVSPLVVLLAACAPATRPVQFEGSYPVPPALEADKPTVAVVLGRDMTEITDVIAPYVAFKISEAFNVVLVAEERRPLALSGGLDVIPHYSFAELEARLGHGPELIVVPNIPDLKANEAARLWIQRHGRGSSTVMSVCAGAAMLAATGLIDGQTATTHWGDILTLEPTYRRVRWVRGQRYVDNGQFVSSAGILSGIDASLHLIARLKGRELAERVAREMHYPTQYLENPSMEQHPFGLNDLLFVMRYMTPSSRPALGVALFDGVDEMALTALYDTYLPWMTSGLVSLAPKNAVITTRYGLHLVARDTPENWANKTTLLPTAPTDPRRPDWLESNFTHTLARADQFPFEAALKTLAQTDAPAAAYTTKRLEYRWFSP